MTIERRVRIVHDDDPCNPRTEYDGHVGRMICWHNRYNLGDQHDYDSDGFICDLACEVNPDFEERVGYLECEVWTRYYDMLVSAGRDDAFETAGRAVQERVDEEAGRIVEANYVVLPLYLYDHSGITMSTGRFSCMWDSGQVGIIVCDKDTIEKEFAGCTDKAEHALVSEVELYDDYLTGNVWGFIAEEREVEDGADLDDDEDWIETDSCWGFYGSDPRTNGIADHLSADYLAVLDVAVTEY